MKRLIRRKSGIGGPGAWPIPVARYYLDEIGFEDGLRAATGRSDLQGAIRVAQEDLLRRRRLCVALFHDGIKRRAQGKEDQCFSRMRECVALVDPLIEPEWYLARHEVEQKVQ